MPHQARLTGAGFSARTRRDSKFRQRLDEIRNLFVQLSGARLQQLGFTLQIVGTAGRLSGDAGFRCRRGKDFDAPFVGISDACEGFPQSGSFALLYERPGNPR